MEMVGMDCLGCKIKNLCASNSFKYCPFDGKKVSEKEKTIKLEVVDRIKTIRVPYVCHIEVAKRNNRFDVIIRIPFCSKESALRVAKKIEKIIINIF